MLQETLRALIAVLTHVEDRNHQVGHNTQEDQIIALTTLKSLTLLLSASLSCSSSFTNMASSSSSEASASMAALFLLCRFISAVQYLLQNSFSDICREKGQRRGIGTRQKSTKSWLGLSPYPHSLQGSSMWCGRTGGHLPVLDYDKGHRSITKDESTQQQETLCGLRGGQCGTMSHPLTYTIGDELQECPVDSWLLRKDLATVKGSKSQPRLSSFRVYCLRAEQGHCRGRLTCWIICGVRLIVTVLFWDPREQQERKTQGTNMFTGKEKKHKAKLP